MALNTTIQDAAAVLRDGIEGGGGAARTSLGGSGTAFGWAGGMVRTIADYATTATCTGMDFKTSVVSESGTPAAVVGENSAKPNAATITEGTVALKKSAGLGIMSLEQALNAQGLAGAIKSVLGASVLKSFEADAVATLDAGAGDTVTGADWVAATAAAQASVIAAGGQPSVLVLSAGDYAAFVGDVTNVNAFSQSPDSPVGALLGSPVHVSPSLAAGTAFVFDSSAVLAVQHENSPLAVLDAYSMADTNQARIVVDLLAAVMIADANLVVKVTAPV